MCISIGGFIIVQESARGAVEIARKVFPEVQYKWGETGLDEIIKDSSIIAVVVVLAGQTQVHTLHLCIRYCIRASSNQLVLFIQTPNNGMYFSVFLE